MKRFHVHLSVPDLDAGIRFYGDLFRAVRIRTAIEVPVMLLVVSGARG